MKNYQLSNIKKMLSSTTKNSASIINYEDLETAIKRFETQCTNDISLISDELSPIEFSIIALYDENQNVIKKIKLTK